MKGIEKIIRHAGIIIAGVLFSLPTTAQGEPYRGVIEQAPAITERLVTDARPPPSVPPVQKIITTAPIEASTDAKPAEQQPLSNTDVPREKAAGTIEFIEAQIPRKETTEEPDPCNAYKETGHALCQQRLVRIERMKTAKKKRDARKEKTAKKKAEKNKPATTINTQETPDTPPANLDRESKSQGSPGRQRTLRRAPNRNL